MITYRSASNGDAAAVAELLSTKLTPRSADSITAILQADGHCFVAEDGGALVGAHTALILESAGNVFPNHPHVPDQLGLIGPVGLFKSIVVSPGSRRQGVGERLVELARDWFLENEIETGLSQAWMRPDGQTPVASILTAIGLEVRMSIQSFWADDLELQGTVCSVCQGPCLCTCVIYAGRLS